MKKNLALLLLVVLLVALTPAIAHAQTGCDDSPENPTAVLALVGGASAAVSLLRNRLRR